MALTSAIAVANEFLKLAEAEGTSVSQMKLQKLLFYAHAWHLGTGKGPLFPEAVEAWPWGPVVRDVYLETKDFGRGAVTGKLTELLRTGDSFLDWKFSAPDGVSDPDTKAFILSVWESYKKYTGIQLSNATHSTGEPWTVVKDKVGSLDGKPVIPNDLIEQVFKAKVANG